MPRREGGVALQSVEKQVGALQAITVPMATPLNIPIEVHGRAVVGFGEDAKSRRILNLGPGHVYLRSIHVLGQEKHSSLRNQPEEPGPLRFGQSPQLLEPGQEIELLTFQSVEKMTPAYDGLAGLVTRESITREIPLSRDI